MGSFSNIVYPKYYYVVIDSKQALPLYKLGKTDTCKYQTYEYRHKSQPVSYGVYDHMNPGQFVEIAVDRGKTYVCPILPDRLNINDLDQ